MRGQNNEELVIDEDFKKLIPPLSPDEYRQLETSILEEGCRDPICLWNGTIIDGHNRYEICIRHDVPFQTHPVHLDSKNEAIAWICSNQIGRRNITEETRKYLIGKRYEAEKIIGSANLRGKNQHHEANEDVPEMWAHPDSQISWKRTSGKIGDEYNISHSTVEKYGIYSRAIDALAKKSDELVPRILSGQTKLSHENIVELAKLSQRELGKISKEVIRNDRNFVGYAAMRRDVEHRHRKPKVIPAVPSESSIKDMPIFDPDAEISSLTLTIPSWISSMKRTEAIADLEMVSAKAKSKLMYALENLKETADTLLSLIKE